MQKAPTRISFSDLQGTLPCAPHFRFIVTGCGRSGTGYTASLLTRLGVACGHEQVFHPWTLNPGYWPDPSTIGRDDDQTDSEDEGVRESKGERAAAIWADLVGDASNMASPYLPRLPRGLVVVHQIREPIAVIRSLLRINFFTSPNCAYRGTMHRDAPHIFQGDPLERAMRYWLEWNRLTEDAASCPHLRPLCWRLEDIDADLVEAFLHTIDHHADRADIERALADNPRQYNTRGNRSADRLTWDDLPSGRLKDQLAEYAASWGYQGVSPDGCLLAHDAGVAA